MTLTELRYLVNLDKERHFGRAAERSFVSQPTLSVALKKLEEALGVTLFERNRGEVRPTPIGERIIAQARRVLAEAALIEDIAKEGQDELSGALRFGAIYTVGPYLLPNLIPLLRRKTPDMPLVIEENFTAVLLEQLRSNELDVAIMALPFDAHGLNTWAVYDEPFVVLMSPEHSWSREETIPARRLADEKLLLLGPGHCFREQVIEACPKCVEPDSGGPRPQTGSSLETIRHMVASGLGITVVPRSSVENRPDEPTLLQSRPFAKPVPERRIALVWRKTFPRLKAVAALHQAILDSGMRGVRFLPAERSVSAG
jgi:LysR family transcriptional regulator, hydrogen peroxide-inducible genes activator